MIKQFLKRLEAFTPEFELANIEFDLVPNTLHQKNSYILYIGSDEDLRSFRIGPKNYMMNSIVIEYFCYNGHAHHPDLQNWQEISIDRFFEIVKQILEGDNQ